VVTVTASPFDGLVSELRDHVEDVASWLVVWEHRAEPDAQGRARLWKAGFGRLGGQGTVRQGYDGAAASPVVTPPGVDVSPSAMRRTSGRMKPGSGTASLGWLIWFASAL
jgi:hypothetical protein